MLQRTELWLYTDKHNKMERDVTLTNFNYFLLQNMSYVLFVYNLVVDTIQCEVFYNKLLTALRNKLRGIQTLIGEHIIGLLHFVHTHVI
jgi:hypothetical protein